MPGCVHTDLLAAGLIADPYLDDERARWQLDRTDRLALRDDVRLAAGRAPTSDVDLVCDGLDTVATVDAQRHRPRRAPQNMHRSYRFDVDRACSRAGEQHARRDVRCAPDRRRAGAATSSAPRPHANAHPFNAVRKMACNFGWDWGPDLRDGRHLAAGAA